MSELSFEKIVGDRLERLANRRRHYETIWIISPTVDEKIVKETLEKNANLVSNKDGTLLRQDDWGKMKMAYEMEKHQQGRYFYFRYIGSSGTVKELERSLKLDANILRCQTIRLSEELSKSQMNDLMQRAPKEPSIPPNAASEDDFDFGGRY